MPYVFADCVLDPQLALLQRGETQRTLRPKVLQVLLYPLPPLAIPATLQDALMARLDRAAPVKAVAQIGAALGREFAYELLAAVSPLPDDALQDALGQLAHAALLFQRGTPPDATYLFKHALVQDTAYASLLRRQRQQLHTRIATMLEAQFPTIAVAEPEVLAHHYTEAGSHEQAIPYWQCAWQRAIERSSYVEAVSHLSRGLTLLKMLPETPERARKELHMQTALSKVLMLTKGYGAPEVEHAIIRARDLCFQLEDTAELFPVQTGLQSLVLLRGELPQSRELAEQLLDMVQRQGEPVLRSRAYQGLGDTLLFLGELAAARASLEQGLAYSQPQQHDEFDFRYTGVSVGVLCLTSLAWNLWLLGYPDQALTRVYQARALAQQQSHPVNLAFALDFAVGLHQLRRDTRAVHKDAEELIALAREQEHPFWVAWGTALRGWTLVEQGGVEGGIAQMWEGLTAYRMTGSELHCPWLLALLAETYGKGGQAEKGLTVLAEALVLTDKTEERWYEVELYRLQGELLLAQEGIKSHLEEAETSFQHALAIAHRQQAKSWELRASISLSRLWQRQGKTQAARELLDPVYHWFTEGFDTVDLQEAQALLEELAE